jgi:adenylate cyclase
MKRPLIVALIVGGVAAAIISVLLATGLLIPAERAIDGFASHHATLTRQVAAPWQYVFVTLLCFGVAWVTLASKRIGWARWVFAILFMELVAVPWVCAVYHVFFQPLPALLAAALSFALALGYRVLGRGSRARRAEEIFSAHVSQEQLDRLIGGGQALEAPAAVHEASVVLCDLAQKYERVEDSSPEALSGMVDQFVRFATDLLLKEGAYLHRADGEGVVAIFGFPVSDADHAVKAATAALRLVRAYEDLQKTAGGLFENTDVHLGISSGSLIAARFENGDNVEMVPIGEPLELSRRFSMANRAYGSRILLGPQTFQLAQNAVVARPIDFLGGAGVREWLEIYELLSLSADATAEQMARRDNFWNGVVYYREKRWGEAYREFQKAFSENGSDDAPLQFYLRRLEPLVLHLIEAPPSEAVPGL